MWSHLGEAISSWILTVWNCPREIPNPMTNGDLISFFASLPEVMLRQRQFEEVDIVIKDGNVVVTRGSLRKRPLRSFSSPFSNGNHTSP